MEIQGKSLLIRPDKLPERTKGGILIPSTAKEKPQTGMVVARGPLCEEVGVGCRVHFARKSASVIEFEGEEYYFTTEDPSNIFYVEDHGRESE